MAMDPGHAGHDPHAADPVSRAIRQAHGILPDQGPIGVFVHHNTLHAFQHLPFHTGVQAGASALGAKPYWSLATFREAVNSGRIAAADVLTEIDRFLGARAGDGILPGLPRREVWAELMLSECEQTDAPGLACALEIGTARERGDTPLWDACLARVTRGPARPQATPVAPRRHRDVLMAHGTRDPDLVVHGELIRLASGFLDQGQARTPMPGRSDGFLRAVARLYAHGARPPRGCPGVAPALRALAQETGAAEQLATAVIHRALAALGVTGDAIEPFLLATALALPGWSGMFARLERHPEEAPEGTPVSLTELLAVRLLLDQHTIAQVVREQALPMDWQRLRVMQPTAAPPSPILEAAILWGLANAGGLSPEAVTAISAETLAGVWEACADCTIVRRQQIFQEAFERSYRTLMLDALAARRALPTPPPVTERPRAQFVFCIDEREESIRRALEEQHPGYLTFGTAGFFGVAIDYLGLDDREPAAHCPVVVSPAHEVHEQPVYTALSQHTARQRWRDQWLGWERRAADASRTLSGGAGLSFLLGPLSGLKTLARVAAPRASRRFGERLAAGLAPMPATRLSAIRVHAEAQATERGKPVGFSLDESVERVTAVLTNLGLVQDFAPIIVFLGHGSTSLNNPHESAHDCGACGGRRGGANARLFADMANRPDVRAGVRARGITIPTDTWFVGALHDTANDAVRYYDLDTLPATAAAPFEDAYAALERARRDDARERCRRFDDAPLTLTPEAALQHVESRAAHLAQPRPEYGHCTNAMAIVGRRSWTRGLHLDRRAFLISYDPTIDADDRILERILAAVGPVGAGISLEYYFSSVDNEVFGCGTKLPHNVTGLLGVMNGHHSDLRTGLPLQMVEIHEPMRLLLVVDATPDALLRVAGRQAEVAELVTKRWIQLVACDPDSGALSVFEEGGFVPYQPHPMLLPVVERSPEWNLRSRAHLPPALVRSALPETVVGTGHHAQGGT